MLDLAQIMEESLPSGADTPLERQARREVAKKLADEYQARRAGGMPEEEAAVRAALGIGLRAALRQEQLHQRLLARWRRFERAYPLCVRWGFLAIVLIPIVFLILMFSLESKIIFLVLWIVSILAIAAFLICVEYLHDAFMRRLGSPPEPAPAANGPAPGGAAEAAKAGTDPLQADGAGKAAPAANGPAPGGAAAREAAPGDRPVPENAEQKEGQP